MLTNVSMIHWQTHAYIDDDIILNYTFYEIKHIFDTLVQELYDTCNSIWCVLNYSLYLYYLFSLKTPPFVFFKVDWQVTLILSQAEIFCLSVNLF